MSAPAWIADAVFYQIFPERFYNGDSQNDPPNTASWDDDLPTRQNFFGGDLEGIRIKIPHLTELGVNALYLTPIFEAASNHKYDTIDYLQIDPSFGTQETFRALVGDLKAAHIRLLLDAVFNHCGDGFRAFQDVVKSGANSRYANWFEIESYPIRFDPPSYQTCGGAPFLPKLNTQNPEVQDYILKVTETWLAEGIDGLRLDVPWKAAPELWTRFYQTVRRHNPEAYIAAEVWRGTRDWLSGDRADGVMNYRLRQNILDYAAFDHMDAEDFDYEVRQLLSEHGSTANAHLTLLGSHDTARIRTVCKGNLARVKIAIALQMTLPGVPMIYYGDEIGMEGENDPDCRRPMIWDETRWERSIYETTRTLVHLRREHPALNGGDLQILRVFNGVYAYARTLADDSVIVVLNPRMEQPRLSIPVGDLSPSAEWVDVLSGMRFNSYHGILCFEPLQAGVAHVLVPAHR